MGSQSSLLVMALPIEMVVEGEYHQMGVFLSQLVALPRIVTLHDFILQPLTKEFDNSLLTLSITIKIVRVNHGNRNDKERGNDANSQAFPNITNEWKQSLAVALKELSANTLFVYSASSLRSPFSEKRQTLHRSFEKQSTLDHSSTEDVMTLGSIQQNGREWTIVQDSEGRVYPVESSV